MTHSPAGKFNSAEFVGNHAGERVCITLDKYRKMPRGFQFRPRLLQTTTMRLWPFWMSDSHAKGWYLGGLVCFKLNENNHPPRSTSVNDEFAHDLDGRVRLVKCMWIV